ncbi:MAG: isoprenylcysteine carboxylmethyltransferase family protein, partial [Patescibacteria group bacterium]
MENAYGLWPLVIIASLFVIGLAWSLTKPKTRLDWSSLGAFSAFIVALFVEMYGFPLTIYLISGWLAEKIPGIDLLAHNSGHLLEDLFGWGGDPHFGPFHIISYILIGYGFILLADAWKVLYQARREHALATTGPYARIRHPQYVAFVLIMLGFLFQWPTLLTLSMFPILVFVYIRLARKEEADAQREFGEVWNSYARQTPAFLPRLKKRLFRCGECGLYYANKEWAEKCEAWCKEHKSCNVDITSHAVEDNSK